MDSKTSNPGFNVLLPCSLRWRSRSWLPAADAKTPVSSFHPTTGICFTYSLQHNVENHSSHCSRMHAKACGSRLQYPISFLCSGHFFCLPPATYHLLYDISRNPPLLSHLITVCRDLARHGYLGAGWQVWWRQAAFAKTSPSA
jgi:hypothetical protein